MSRRRELTEGERREIKKKIRRLGRYWYYHQEYAGFALGAYFLALFAACGFIWLVVPEHPIIDVAFLAAGKTLFASLSSIFLLAAIWFTTTSVSYGRSAGRLFKELFASIRKIVVVDVEGLPNKCTVVFPKSKDNKPGDLPFVLRWVPGYKHSMLTDAMESIPTQSCYQLDIYRNLFERRDERLLKLRLYRQQTAA